MSTHTPTWAVVATVDEHPAVVQTFVAWYLSLGADAIHLYFDRPDDPAADLFAAVAKVHVVRCDADYWARINGRRPVRHQVRQIKSATDAVNVTTAEWLLHCDGDEYLWPSRDVADILADAQHEPDGLLVPVAERRFLAGADTPHIFTGVFRRPEEVGAPAPQMTLRGLTGHSMGKAFVRTTSDIQINIHRPQRDQVVVAIPPMPDTALLHFDGLTRLQWIEKLLRKSDMAVNKGGAVPTRHRQRQIDKVLRHLPDAARVHDQTKVLQPRAVEDLRARDLLLEVDFDPATPLAALTGARDLISPEDYDAWLLENRAARVPYLAEVADEKRPPQRRPSSFLQKLKRQFRR